MSDVAYLVLRALFSFVFLNAAWQCGKSKEGVEWTIEESRILFGEWAPMFGIGGIGVMAVGGLSVLLGIYPEIGASMLAVFLVLGSVIHFRRQKDSKLFSLRAQRLHCHDRRRGLRDFIPVVVIAYAMAYGVASNSIFRQLKFGIR